MKYRIELWKGSYLYGALYGAEIGLYHRTESFPIEIFVCSTDQYLQMTFALSDKSGNILLISDNEEKWWQTEYGIGSYKADQLNMHAVITFPTEQTALMDPYMEALRFNGTPYTKNGNSVIIDWNW